MKRIAAGVARSARVGTIPPGRVFFYGRRHGVRVQQRSTAARRG
jgi:hypothetical protein